MAPRRRRPESGAAETSARAVLMAAAAGAVAVLAACGAPAASPGPVRPTTLPAARPAPIAPPAAATPVPSAPVTTPPRPRPSQPVATAPADPAPRTTPETAPQRKPAPRTARTGYQVNRNPDGTITRWDPCRPITYRTNLTHAPSGAAADIRSALTTISAATGLRFTPDGTTTRIPTAATLTDPTTADLTIAWAPPGRTDLLNNRTESARGGWQTAPTLDPATGLITWRIVRGYVLLDTGDARTWKAGFGPGRRRGTLLLHELGHAVGLNHTTAPGQVMNAQIDQASTGAWGDGDRAGLRAVGATGGCLP